MRTSVLNFKAEQMESNASEHSPWASSTKQHLRGAVWEHNMRALRWHVGAPRRTRYKNTAWKHCMKNTLWPFCMRVPLSALEVYCVSIACENTLYRPSLKTPCGSTVWGLHMRPSHEITFTEFPMETSYTKGGFYSRQKLCSNLSTRVYPLFLCA